MKPLQWIEQAEARQVLGTALFEQPSQPSPGIAARAVLAKWFAARAARPWLSAALPCPAPVWPAQPALARRPAFRPALRRDDFYC